MGCFGWSVSAERHVASSREGRPNDTSFVVPGSVGTPREQPA